MAGNGQAILTATQIVQQVGTEAEALLSMMKEVLSNVKGGVRFKKPTEFSDTDKSGYIYDHAGIAAQAHRFTGLPGQPPFAGEFTILLDFGRRHGVAEFLGFACAIAAWSTVENGWGFDENFWDEFWPSRQDQMTIRADRLFWWIESSKDADASLKEPPIKSEWFYVVPLTALTNKDAATSLLIDPALGLLGGAEARDALRREGICQFSAAMSPV